MSDEDYVPPPSVISNAIRQSREKKYIPVLEKTMNPNPLYVVLVIVVILICIVLIYRLTHNMAGVWYCPAGNAHIITHNVFNSVSVDDKQYKLDGDILKQNGESVAVWDGDSLLWLKDDNMTEKWSKLRPSDK